MKRLIAVVCFSMVFSFINLFPASSPEAKSRRVYRKIGKQHVDCKKCHGRDRKSKSNAKKLPLPPGHGRLKKNLRR